MGWLSHPKGVPAFAVVNRVFNFPAAADSEALVNAVTAEAVNRVMAYEDATSGSVAPAPRRVYLAIVAVAVVCLIHGL